MASPPAMVRVAEELAPIFTAAAEADHEAAAEQANRLMERHGAQPRLVRHPVLGSGARDRLGVCTASRCDRVYVDTSHNGSRRFCSTACQNRVKTAAFRARNRS